MKIFETIPNFSEGQNEGTLLKIKDAFESVPGVKLLDYTADFDHNRSVFTAIGSGENLVEALIRAAKTARDNIDLRTHKGLHPRVGAMDVVPIVPISEASMEEAISLSHLFGKRLLNELQVPSFYYEESATAEHRKNLADVRKGEFEGLEEKMQSPLWHPDNGENHPHPSAGVTITGARKPLIAYNIFLSTDDVQIAKKIASSIREKNGGLLRVKALGLFVEHRNMAQVSMNLTDYTVTPPKIVFDRVRELANSMGVDIFSSELIGLMPKAALDGTTPEYLQIENFNRSKIIENRL